MFINGNHSVSIKLDDNKLTLSGPDNTQCSLPYKDIVSINFIEKADYTTFKGGYNKGRYMVNSWDCQSLGICQLFIDSKISSCIAITTNTQTVLLNYESIATTKSFYQALTDFWQQHKT
jgi:hypothetical protein